MTSEFWIGLPLQPPLLLTVISARAPADVTRLKMALQSIVADPCSPLPIRTNQK